MNISNTAAASVTPAIAVGGTGNIYAVWENDNPENTERLLSLRNGPS
jgi:hypothetical protein